jgi:ribosomal protein L11 methyltransferase
MIPADATLYIYEIRGDAGPWFADAPESFVGVWNEDEFAYIFFTSPQDDYVRRSVEGRAELVGPACVIAYRDWQAGTPHEDGRIAGIRVTPPGPLCRPGPDTVALDPSVVFGDGSHPTTSSCLRLLRRLIRSYEPASLLDLGAGTGILAIAAAAMGVRRVLAVDKNRLCVETTRKNVRLNGYCNVIDAEEGDAIRYVGRPYAVVAANLPFSVLCDLSDSPSAGNHRMWLVSGVNPAQGTVIEGLLAHRGFSVVHRLETPPWTTFAMVKTS